MEEKITSSEQLLDKTLYLLLISLQKNGCLLPLKEKTFTDETTREVEEKFNFDNM